MSDHEAEVCPRQRPGEIQGTTRRTLLGTVALGSAALTLGAPSAHAAPRQGLRTRLAPWWGRPAPRGTDAAPSTAAKPTIRVNASSGGHPILAEAPTARAADAERRRQEAARDLFADGLAEAQAVNGDEGLYDDYRASFTKALPHDGLGEVDKGAYRSLLDALRTRTDAAFEAIRLAPTSERRLVSPQAGYGYMLAGMDGQASRMPAAPAFASDETAGEMHELYWKALLRDVPFRTMEDSPLFARAVADVAATPAPAGGLTEAAELFRGPTPGDRAGPMISQFLWADVPFGNGRTTQRYPRPGPRADWGTEVPEWLAVQRGEVPGDVDKRGARFIHDGRSLAEYVHVDFSYQAYLNAALILLGLGPDFVTEGNPTLQSRTTTGFATFGGPDVLDLVATAAKAGLHAAWFQKWSVHRRLRPEAYGGRLHHQMFGQKAYGVPQWLLDTDAVRRTRYAQGTGLLGQAYPEGSPTHPAYPAGHATMAGACCTVLKAFFREEAELPSPVQANALGTALEPYAGALTVRGEVDKLASNVSLGRDWGGVHYRSDGIEGMLVGEAVAISLLSDRAACYAQGFDGFTLTRFDGTRVRIGAEGAVA